MTFKALEKYKAKEKEKKLRAKERKKRQKKKEKEKKKAETHKRMLKKKRDAYKPIHVKYLQKKRNARAYKKRRDASLAEHRAKGDEYGYYRIIIARNYEHIQNLAMARWKVNAYERFYKFIEENHKDVICEKQCLRGITDTGNTVKYEILLIKKINPNEDNGIREFRNEIGTFIENRIENNNTYAIIAKEDWYIPEDYHVYGYNPMTERKTGRWIYDNIINKNCCRENLKNVFMCNNKLIVQYNGDIDLIICKNAAECMRLYNKLQDTTPKSNKFVFYSAFLDKNRIEWLYDLIEDKTGWPRTKIQRSKMINKR